MMPAIDLLRELARQSRRVRMMCPCSSAYPKAKEAWQSAELAAFAYLHTLDMTEGVSPETPLEVVEPFFTEEGGDI